MFVFVHVCFERGKLNEIKNKLSNNVKYRIKSTDSEKNNVDIIVRNLH